jgi:hypothetical protein
VFGHLVDRVQRALAAAGFPSGPPDMTFGPATQSALAGWRAAQAGPKEGPMTSKEWTALTNAPSPALFDLCAQIVAAFEGHGFGKAVGDFDGAVATWGYHGFTWRFGHIQAILADLDASAPEALDAAFGREGVAGLREALQRPLVAQIDWARDAMLDARGTMRTDWRDGFARLGETPAARRAQLVRSRSAFWDAIAAPQARRLGFSHPLGVAMLFDAAIQQGGAGRRTLEAVDAASGRPEAERRAVLAERLAAQVRSDRFRQDVRARRAVFVRGFGRAHGAFFVLSDWGLPPSGD